MALPRALTVWTTRVLVLVLVLLLRSFDIGHTEPAVLDASRDHRGFEFLYVDAETGSPVRFSACAPVHYAINPEHAPEGAIDDAHRAFEETGAATGIRFVYDGTTSEPYSVDREPYQPDRYGERWAPVLLAWSPVPLSDRYDYQGRQAIGLGGGVIVSNEDGRPVFVTGAAVFDASYDLDSGYGGRTWGGVMLHELGHVVGLDHIEDESSVMFPGSPQRPSMFGEGDKAGLWELGAGSECVMAPAVP